MSRWLGRRLTEVQLVNHYTLWREIAYLFQECAGLGAQCFPQIKHTCLKLAALYLYREVSDFSILSPHDDWLAIFMKGQ